jgi:hypothetical protein
VLSWTVPGFSVDDMMDDGFFFFFQVAGLRVL